MGMEGRDCPSYSGREAECTDAPELLMSMNLEELRPEDGKDGVKWTGMEAGQEQNVDFTLGAFGSHKGALSRPIT